MPGNPGRETWDYDMEEGGLAVKTPPPEKEKPASTSRDIAPMKEALCVARKITPRTFPPISQVDRVKAVAQAKEAEQEREHMQQEAMVVQKRLQELSTIPQGRKAATRRATVESIRKESTLGAVRREMATVTTPHEQQKGKERVQRAAIVKAATVKSRQERPSTLAAVRREMANAFTPQVTKVQEVQKPIDVPLLTELFNDTDEEHMPEVQPLPEESSSKQTPFVVEPEGYDPRNLEFKKSEEPKGWLARGWAKVKSWF